MAPGFGAIRSNYRLRPRSLPRGVSSMAKYQVPLVERPTGWEPNSPDDAPPRPGKPESVLASTDDLFSAVRQAIDYNQSAEAESAGRWAVVVEPGNLGRTWPGARFCTPLAYKVAAIWWPTGWEPQSPLDVPNCVWRAQGEPNDQLVSYQEAVATVQSLNHQGMNLAAARWFVVVAIENEPLSHTVSLDPSGTETTVKVRKIHLIRPDGGGHGDCAHCPAHSFDCAKENPELGIHSISDLPHRPIDVGG